MSILGNSILVKGDVWASTDLAIEGRVEGAVTCDGFAVTLAPTAHVVGDVLARDITVAGHVEGQLVASDVIDIRAEATVNGRLITGRLILNDGATFNGHVEPQHLEAALRVARFNRQKDQKEQAAARRP
jgi:cytoskeletal protein CcmA (bactofilin family)